MKLFDKNIPVTPNGWFGDLGEKRLPPDQGYVTEVRCRVGDSLPFILELTGLIIEHHNATGYECLEEARVFPCKFVRLCCLESPSGIAWG